MIDLKNDGDVAVVTIRHGKANALDIELCEGLAKCFDELRRSDARAVVADRAGPNVFRRRRSHSSEFGWRGLCARVSSVLHRLYDAVFFHPKPVVAAINGHAIAGGCVLACCADRRIMAASERPHRRNRASGRRAVSGAGFRDRAVRGARALSDRVHVRRRHLRHRCSVATRLGRCGGAGRNPYGERDGHGPAMAQLSPAAFVQAKKQLRQDVSDSVARSGRRPTKSSPTSGPRRNRSATFATTSGAR